MGWEDVFHFDAVGYATRLTQCTDIEIKKREVTKMRKFILDSCVNSGGIGTAPATGGLSLFLASIGARRAVVAHKKLRVIRAELSRRHNKFHTMTKDFCLSPESNLSHCFAEV